MSDILQMFTGNPLATLVGKKIEAATSPLLEAEDWALNMEICDIISESDDEAKNAVRAIRKRLQQIEQERDFTVKSYTYLLTVLETCVSNCSHRFRTHVMTKDFIQDLVKFIGPKNNPPIDLQERVLRLIERWAEGFKSYPDLSGVVQVYNELKAKGVIFPARDASTDVPIDTPQARHTSNTSSPMHRQQAQISTSAGPVQLEGEVYSKICRDLEVVQSSLNVFNSIMDQIVSTDRDKKVSGEEDWSLSAELNTTCMQMKDRIVELIEKVLNEDLTIELLRLNDGLNNVFERYEDLVQQKDQLQSSTLKIQPSTTSVKQNLSDSQVLQPDASSSSTKQQSRTEDETSLIDFKDEEAKQLQQLLDDTTNDKLAQQHQLHPSPNPFDTSVVADAFLRADNSFASTSGQTSLVSKLDKFRISDNQKELDAKNAKVSAGNAGDIPEAIATVREQDFIEIQNWLSSDGGIKPTDGNHQSASEPISIPNSEFENFIATRALVGSQSQNTAAPNQSNRTITTSTITATAPVIRKPEPEPGL